jgi:hypothetical protein
MPPPSPGQPAWPRWLVLLASAPIVYHLSSLALGALAAPSGPWPTPEGAGMSLPPPAVASAYDGFAQPYLRAAKLTHNYHYPSNRVGNPDAYLEVHLEDAAGNALSTVRVPDLDAPPYVQRRQALLMRYLVDDQPVQPPTSERIYPPGQTPPRLSIWEMNEPGRLYLAEITEMEVPRNRPVFRPTEWSLIVVRSCARHLCRVHGAGRAHVVRHSREALHPGVLVGAPTPPGAYEELVSDYGRFPR